MNVLFSLIPKDKVSYVEEKMSVRQVLEKMEANRYTSIPVLSEDGRYLGTISEGDILWFIKKRFTIDMKELESINVMEIKRMKDNDAVYVYSDMDSLIKKATNQNFIPVLDDRNLFIGIVTRKSIINYLIDKNSE